MAITAGYRTETVSDPSVVSRVRRIIGLLKRSYPDAGCSLAFQSPFQLLVSTILSAQCTDVRVNAVTAILFKKYPTAQLLAIAPVGDIENIIRPIGFYRNKARAICESANTLVKHYSGEVPMDMSDLLRLKGVGRKTANVVLGNAWGKLSGVVVDTHVGRISRRLGFTQHVDPIKLERDLMVVIPMKFWIIFPHWMIAHGRAVCKAPRPLCNKCALEPMCPKNV